MIRPSMERSLQGVGSASIFMSDVGYFDTTVLWAGGGKDWVLLHGALKLSDQVFLYDISYVVAIDGLWLLLFQDI